MEIQTLGASVAALTFRSPTGHSMRVRDAHITLTYGDGELVECRVEFALTHDQWEKVDGEHLFNLKPEVRGPSYLDPFEQDGDIEIEARLDA
ncbi:MAG: hypothetical protein JRJ84_08775, partial [Deltaproteobacteria bacterium]|nr:hypothetical protein [Deltaproteobacteria bacterium]